MPHTTTIRYAVPKDLMQIVSLCEVHAAYEEAAYNRQGAVERLSAHLFLDSPAFFCLVVEKEYRLVGYTTYMRQFATWDAAFYLYMDCLFLLEEVRGKGIGVQLMKKIVSEAKRLDCTHIQWQTPHFNIRAIRFYKRLGAKSKNKERFFLKI